MENPREMANPARPLRGAGQERAPWAVVDRDGAREPGLTVLLRCLAGELQALEAANQRWPAVAEARVTAGLAEARRELASLETLLVAAGPVAEAVEAALVRLHATLLGDVLPLALERLHALGARMPGLLSEGLLGVVDAEGVAH